MSLFTDGCYQCAPAEALIAKVLAGRCTMHYTRVAVGSGSIPEGSTPATMTEPAGYVMDAKLSGVTNPVDGECQVTAQITSDDVTADFSATGVLLYAEDPDLGEVPYTYLVLEAAPEPIKGKTSTVGKIAIFELVAAVGAVDNVTADIDLETLVTVEKVAEMIAAHNVDEEAHPDIRQIAQDALDQVEALTHTISTIPTQNGSLTYTGSPQSPSWNGYDPATLTLGGTTEATDAGTYTATFTPKDDYQWADGTKDPKSVQWSIGRANIASVPTQTGSLTYNGSAQSPTWSGYDASRMTLGGTTSGTNAGSYQATFTPTSNFQWSDGTYGAKNATWSIAKAAGSLSINPTTMTLDVSTLQKTIAVTRAGNGVISVSVDNTAIAEASLSGTTITVTGKAKGTAKITVSVAAGTNHTAPASAVCTATVSLPSKTLADNDPATIQAVGAAGTGASYWAVGDKIGIAVNGTFGGLTLNQTVYAFILGFNHNQSVEGNGIDFQFGKTADGRDIAFVQSYGSTGSGFCMNTSNTNSGGWKNSYMMKTICPAFLNALPAAWRNAIKNCTKYSDNTGGGNDTASYVTATTQKIFLLAEFEVHGTRYYANSAEKNYQKQYDYYKNGNSKVKYQHSSTGSACLWWLRSVRAGNTAYFCGVSPAGSADYYIAYHSLGFAPGFDL